MGAGGQRDRLFLERRRPWWASSARRRYPSERENRPRANRRRLEWDAQRVRARLERGKSRRCAGSISSWLGFCGPESVWSKRCRSAGERDEAPSGACSSIRGRLATGPSCDCLVTVIIFLKRLHSLSKSKVVGCLYESPPGISAVGSGGANFETMALSLDACAERVCSAKARVRSSKVSRSRRVHVLALRLGSIIPANPPTQILLPTPATTF